MDVLTLSNNNFNINNNELVLCLLLPPGMTKRRFWAKFHLFSAYFLPMVPHPPFLSPHVYGICLFST